MSEISLNKQNSLLIYICVVSPVKKKNLIKFAQTKIKLHSIVNHGGRKGLEG